MPLRTVPLGSLTRSVKLSMVSPAKAFPRTSGRQKIPIESSSVCTPRVASASESDHCSGSFSSASSSVRVRAKIGRLTLPKPLTRYNEASVTLGSRPRILSALTLLPTLSADWLNLASRLVRECSLEFR